MRIRSEHRYAIRKSYESDDILVSFSFDARRSAFREAAAGLPVRLPRVAYYFSLRIRDKSDDVRMCYDAAFMIDGAHFVATALKLEIENHRRVWTCSDKCIAFLARFDSLDDFYVD